MKELINLARGFTQQFECALVYGIANVAQLDNLFKVNAKQFVVVEADPNVFSKLEEWHSTLPETAPKVSCYHAAITQEDAPTTLLYQASQQGFSSTAKPNQIKRFRPGLSFSSVSVPAKKLSYFTDKYAITANQHNIALVNCNGAEHQILSEPTSHLFSNIVVKTCSKALFGENTQLPAALTDTGYSQVKIKSAQPPMSVAALCKPLLVLEQASALEKARHEAEQYKQQVSDLIAQNETLTEQRDNQREHHLKNKEWAEGLNESNKALQAKLEQLEPEFNKVSEQQEALKAQLNNAEKREEQLTSTLTLNTKLLTKIQSDSEHLREQYKEKVKSEEELRKLVSELHQKLQQAATFYHKLEQQYPELLSETNKVSDFKSMQGELLAALDILDDYQHEAHHVFPDKQTGLVISEADSLLARCEQVVKQHENSGKPKMRVIHHFACSGGTLISKCIAALPNVYLLSEVHPATHNHMGGGKPKFLPSDITTLSRYAGIPDISHLADKLFKQNVIATNKHVVEQGGVLVLRDHTHSDFCVGNSVRDDSKVVSVLSEEFEILRVVTIRHPVDAYLSLVKNNWEQHTPKGFEEYCKRFLLFINSYNKNQIFKYEDVVKSPVKSIKKIAKKLDLPFSDSFIDTFSTMQVTGDSGRSGAVIEERPRRPLSDEQIAMINSSKSFKKIAKKFNYGIPGEVE